MGQEGPGSGAEALGRVCHLGRGLTEEKQVSARGAHSRNGDGVPYD